MKTAWDGRDEGWRLKTNVFCHFLAASRWENVILVAAVTPWLANDL